MHPYILYATPTCLCMCYNKLNLLYRLLLCFYNYFDWFSGLSLLADLIIASNKCPNRHLIVCAVCVERLHSHSGPRWQMRLIYLTDTRNTQTPNLHSVVPFRKFLLKSINIRLRKNTKCLIYIMCVILFAAFLAPIFFSKNARKDNFILYRSIYHTSPLFPVFFFFCTVQ